MVLKFLLWTVVVIHLVIVAINVIAIPVLLAYAQWYISVPLVTFLVRLAIVERRCPLTALENYIRKKVNLPTINSFIGHYIVKHIRRAYGRYTT